MKKKFLLPVMALMLCVISCKDDKGSDNSSSSNQSNFKKLVSISTSDENDSMTFSYDKNGNLVSAIESEKEEFTDFYYEHITQYSWEGEDITVSDDYEDELSYTVKNGKIVEGFDLEAGDITTFAYDSSGRLIKISNDDYYGEKRCFWSNDRLSSVVEEISPYESRSSNSIIPMRSARDSSRCLAVSFRIMSTCSVPCRSCLVLSRLHCHPR